MSKYIISGYYGFGNAGDEAILQAIVDSLRQLDPQALVTVLSANPQATRVEHGVTAVARTGIWQIAGLMRQSDLFISGGGGLLQDATSSRSLLYYLGLIRLARFLGCQTMLYANSLGPVTRPRNRLLTSRTLQQMGFITVRDRLSWKLAQELGIRSAQMELTADPVLLMRPTRVQPVQRRLAVAVRDWRSPHDYLTEVAKAARVLTQDGFQIQFVPLHYSRDLAIAQKLAAEVGSGAICLDQPMRFDQLLATLAEAELVVAMRLHALIMSAICLRPMVGIAYDPKVNGFLQSIGQPVAGTTLDLKAEQLVACIQDTYERRAEISRELEQKLVLQRSLAARNAEIAVSLAKGVGRR